MSFTLLQETERKARRSHRCIWCPELIKRHEHYIDERCVYEGEVMTQRYHPECQTAMHQAAREEGGFIEFSAHECKRGTTEPA